MEIANLLIKRNGYFYLKGNELVALKTFADDNTWFNGYDSIYGKKGLVTADISKIEPAWFDYVQDSMKPDLFKSDIKTILSSLYSATGFRRIYKIRSSSLSIRRYTQ